MLALAARKLIVRAAWQCSDSDLLRLPRHSIVTPSTPSPQQRSTVFPSTFPPNDMNVAPANLEAAHVMQQLVDMGLTPSVAERAIASVGPNRAIEHSGAIN